jgi:uncharacterized protein YdcH (DUF465 family)
VEQRPEPSVGVPKPQGSVVTADRAGSPSDAAPRAGNGRGVLVSGTVGGQAMFEGQPQSEIDALMKADPEFKQLYQRHKLLDKKCMDAELGVLPIDDMTLGQMKREKLMAKEKLTRLYDRMTH